MYRVTIKGERCVKNVQSIDYDKKEREMWKYAKNVQNIDCEKKSEKCENVQKQSMC